jgi:alkylation response protein AidB-like acyl-CoA dehydrogenase
VDFTLNDDQVSLGGELRRLLSTACDPDRRRAAIDLPGAVDRDLWRVLGDTGVFGLVLDEGDGGVGLGFADATVVFEELGRAGVPGPVIASMLAASLVGDASSGERVVGVCEAASPQLVEHLAGLDVLLVLDADGIRSVEPALVSGRLLPRPLDPLTPVHLVSELPRGVEVGDRGAAETWRRNSALLAAAVQVGLGATAVGMAVAYAQEREQFGKPIGSFQALKHLLADAHTAVELARVAVQAAGVTIDEDGGVDEVRRAVASARLVASRAAHAATTTCIQVHGGMGYTWELDAHLLLKRVLVLDQAPGTVEGAVEERAACLA